MFSSEEKMDILKKNMDILKKAFDEYAKEYTDTLPSEEKTGVFSETFEVNMQKLIQRQKRFYFSYINTVGKRVACIVLVVFIGLFATVFSVDAFREPIINFIVETHKKFTAIFPAQASSDIDDSFVFEIFEPQYIPDGFTAEEPSVRDVGYTRRYIDADGNYYAFAQELRSKAVFTINTEDKPYEKMYIHGSEAIYYETNEMRGIIFSIDDYTFSVTGCLSKETLIKIAESIKIN